MAKQLHAIQTEDILIKAGFLSSKPMGGFESFFKGALLAAGNNPEDLAFSIPLRSELTVIADLVRTEKERQMDLSDVIQAAEGRIFDKFKITASGYGQKMRDAYTQLEQGKKAAR